MSEDLTTAIARVSLWLSSLPRPDYRGPGLRSTPIAEIETLVAALASAIDARQRPDTEEWLDPKGESAAPQEDAPTQALYSLKDVG